MVRIVVALWGAGAAISVGALSLLPPPLPPADWEASVDTRFEPRVEQALIAISVPGTTFDQDAARALWAGWGPTAAERLRALLDDDAWWLFDEWTERLYFSCPFESEGGGIEAYLLDALDREEVKAADAPYMRARSSVIRYAEMKGAEAIPFLVRLAEDERPHVSVAGVRGLLATNNEPGQAEAARHIDRLAGSTDRKVVRGVVYLLRTIGSVDALERAVSLAKPIDLNLTYSVGQELAAEIERLAEVAETEAGQRRAQEPMRPLEGRRR